MNDFAKEVDAFYYWRLCDEFSVVQAALLVIGEDPTLLQGDIDGWQARDRPFGYDAVKSALISAIRSKRLSAVVPEIDAVDEHGHNGTWPDWGAATIQVDDLKAWLESRGVKSGFFFEHRQSPNYLLKSHSCYSTKLAAAVSAWLAVSEIPSFAEVRRSRRLWMSGCEHMQTSSGSRRTMGIPTSRE